MHFYAGQRAEVYQTVRLNTWQPKWEGVPPKIGKTGMLMSTLNLWSFQLILKQTVYTAFFSSDRIRINMFSVFC